jgi:hypothetical protein
MANFSDRNELNWVVQSIAPAGVKTVDLKPFQFGLVDKETHKTINVSALTGDAYFAVGSPNAPQATDGQRVNKLYNSLNSDISFKSTDLGNIAKLKFVKPQKQNLEQVYYLGWNGLDDCESLNFECGKNYKFQINVQGQNVQNVFGAYERNEIVSVDTPCCDASCGCVDGKIDCSYVIDDLMARFDSDLFWVKRFYKVEKLISCSPALSVPAKTNFTTYTLTVCDNGDAVDMAKVQAQYTPTIKVRERKAPFTTYEFTQLAATAAPAAYSQSLTTVRDCTSCPAGFTSVAAGFAYVVEIDNTNADVTLGAQLTAVQTVFATATYAKKENFSFGTSTYYVVSSAKLTAPTGDARIVKDLDLTTAKCTQTAPITTAWVSAGTSFKITRALTLTKQNADCQSNPEELAEIQAYYAGNPEIVPGTLLVDAGSTACIIRFDVTQYCDNLLVDGCDVFGHDGAKFNSLPSWKGFKWEVIPCEGWTVNGSGCPVPPAPADKCCKCGIKFTTLTMPEPGLPEGIYDLNFYQEKDPVNLSVTIYKPDGEPYVCGSKSPTFRKTKSAEYQILKGYDVIKEILITRNDRQERFMNLTDKDSLLLLARQGTEFGVKVNDFYYAINITNHISRFENHPMAGKKEVITLYIHENDIVLFENLKGQLSSGFPLAKVEQV